MKIKFNGKIPQQDPIFILLYIFIGFCMILMLVAMAYDYLKAADTIPYLRK